MRRTAYRPEAARRYLVAVDRAASALPPDRRAELQADLAEHIDVALAERPGELDAVLAELGDPREIAATALRESAESGEPVLRGRGSPRTVIALFAVHEAGFLLSCLPMSGAVEQGTVIAFVCGLVTLCISRWWTAAQKWTAVAWLLLPGVALQGVDTALGGGTPASIACRTADAIIRIAALVWLWHRRSAPTGPGYAPIPRWVKIALWAVPIVCVVLAIGGAVMYSRLDSGLTTASVP